VRSMQYRSLRILAIKVTLRHRLNDGAFAFLLESALAMNGIYSNWIQINATDYNSTTFVPKVVINNWCLVGANGCPNGSPTYTSQSPWVYKFTLDPQSTGDLMVPVPSGGFGDLTNETGLAGQGEPPPSTPVEKVFDFHFIVQIPIASGNQYYDPSYGKTYSSASDFESKAVAGYATQINGDVLHSGS
jgi:hypothetical protein